TISAASDGTFVITNDKNEIWRKNADDFNDGWTRVNGTSAKVVAIAANRFWSMGADGKVYRYDGIGNWNKVGVTISDIAASADGSISVVNTTTREIWRKTTDDNNGTWTKAMGKGLQLAAPAPAGSWWSAPTAVSTASPRTAERAILDTAPARPKRSRPAHRFMGVSKVCSTPLDRLNRGQNPSGRSTGACSRRASLPVLVHALHGLRPAPRRQKQSLARPCLLSTSHAADDLHCL
ncbi:tectonin domain-containing protein, partial [Aureimonas ureilytica]|uniref:tectonin domain-containing protein n=1 Tax=Aureimonas ureilytica TaxID=401562 RepID=UPI000ADDEE23